jgi:hypothetical protein
MLSGWIEAAYERRDYFGTWTLGLDTAPGSPRGARVDHRAGGATELRCRWAPEGGPELDLTLRYRFEHVVSTAESYRADQHDVSLGVAASF